MAAFEQPSESEGDVMFAITGVCAELRSETLEEKISFALNLAQDRISVMDNDDGQVLFVVYPREEETEEDTNAPEKILMKMRAYIDSGGATVAEWLSPKAECSLAAMEEDEYIEEEEALTMWRDMPEEVRTSHLAAVPSPDGELILPTHYEAAPPTAGADAGAEQLVIGAPEVLSPTQMQLKRDPHLLELDNVRRVHASELGAVSWTEPVIITGCSSSRSLCAAAAAGKPSSEVPLDGSQQDAATTCSTYLFEQARLAEVYGGAEVRTGNRNTLVENGFVNSRPMALREALGKEPERGGGGGGGDPECSRIVFSPVKELPQGFRLECEDLAAAFPCEHAAQGKEPKVSKKFTLCLGAEGFGIGFHRHNAAMFLLVVGRKKWYMGPEATEDDTPTHPGFYTTKSSHKCIQHPGEVLYVPDQWYHEIFNLEYTAGIQALPA